MNIAFQYNHSMPNTEYAWKGSCSSNQGNLLNDTPNILCLVAIKCCQASMADLSACWAIQPIGLERWNSSRQGAVHSPQWMQVHMMYISAPLTMIRHEPRTPLVFPCTESVPSTTAWLVLIVLVGFLSPSLAGMSALQSYYQQVQLPKNNSSRDPSDRNVLCTLKIFKGRYHVGHRVAPLIIMEKCTGFPQPPSWSLPELGKLTTCTLPSKNTGPRPSRVNFLHQRQDP